MCVLGNFHLLYPGRPLLRTAGHQPHLSGRITLCSLVASVASRGKRWQQKICHDSIPIKITIDYRITTHIYIHIYLLLFTYIYYCNINHSFALQKAVYKGLTSRGAVSAGGASCEGCNLYYFLPRKPFQINRIHPCSEPVQVTKL